MATLARGLPGAFAGAVALAAVFVGIGLLAARPAVAKPMVTVTNCDSVTVNGNRYPHFMLDLYNPSPTRTATTLQLSYPQFDGNPADSCSFILSASPAGWYAYGTFWIQDGFELGLGPGQSIGGFEVVLTRGDCCFTAIWGDNLLMDPVAVEPACLHCDRPTPARSRSWGEVKAIYR